MTQQPREERTPLELYTPDSYPVIDQARRYGQDIESRMKAYLLALENGAAIDRSALRSLLQTNITALEGIQGFADQCLESVPKPYRHTPESTEAAIQVFITYELFEKIALHLNPWDLLCFSMVNRDTLGILSDSSKLKRQLSFPSVHGSGYLHSAFSEECYACYAEVGADDDEAFPGLLVTYNYAPKQMQDDSDADSIETIHRVNITAYFDSSKKLPRIGTRWRGMLISEPPIHVMQITLTCCDRPKMQWPRYWATVVDQPNSSITYRLNELGQHLDDDTVLKNDVTKSMELMSRTGITVGNVLDATEKLREKHALCPHASAELHDRKTGEVMVAVKFHTEATLRNDDPYAISQANKDVAQELEEEEGDQQYYTPEDFLIEKYIRAKKKAHENGWEIPTFQTFKKNVKR